jgi:hypothetical protein
MIFKHQAFKNFLASFDILEFIFKIRILGLV